MRSYMWVGNEMQQKLGDRKLLLCKDVAPPSGVAFLQLPFRCPRCGERQRLRSLSSLRGHLEHQPAYHTVHRLCSSSAWDPVDGQGGHKKADVTGCTDRCQSSEPGDMAESAGTAGTLKEGTVGERGEEQPGVGSDSGTLSYRLAQMVPMEVRAPCRLEEALRTANGTMMRRLQRLSTDLAQVDLELLRAHARFRHLAREKQQVSDRERALCRQVDTAVVEIGRLRERLSLSEQELEKKELEVISIHNFLEAATQHEMCGKVRLQNFIENLLQRISLAERLLEYYHGPSNLRHCRNYMMFQPVENGLRGMAESRSAGCPEVPPVCTEAKAVASQNGRSFPNPSRERRRSKQNFCQSDHT
ncbi:protein ZNF365 isoform X2 [Brienomyrus brachyistius]|uniref:protein ZNF365 isoform X2 n=1 Tax=Brienomyrus brachyistius TaxID=42636 RepID=UPI0020B2FFD6|nr:protein ZNF365 isoform X2 [Brienomyrus brachyistius]